MTGRHSSIVENLRDAVTSINKACIAAFDLHGIEMPLAKVIDTLEHYAAAAENENAAEMGRAFASERKRRAAKINGSKGGKIKAANSMAKQQACRVNGSKGGRPREDRRTKSVSAPVYTGVQPEPHSNGG